MRPELPITDYYPTMPLAPCHSLPATVYVVDDDASFLTAVTRLLRAGGYAVKTFDSAAGFLQNPARERGQRARQRALQARFNALTPRQREVLAHVLSGQLNKQIAGDLGASERTIKAHRANLMAKLGVQSVAELARLAQEAGISVSSDQ